MMNKRFALPALSQQSHTKEADNTNMRIMQKRQYALFMWSEAIVIYDPRQKFEFFHRPKRVQWQLRNQPDRGMIQMVRIPAHREHPFRSIVSSDSGRT
jgi:hypothetical protein